MIKGRAPINESNTFINGLSEREACYVRKNLESLRRLALQLKGLLPGGALDTQGICPLLDREPESARPTLSQ